MEHKRIPRWQQRLGGFLVFLACSGFIAWGWHTAIHEGYYYPRAALMFPMLATVGAGALLFPGYKQERIDRGEDISQLSGSQLITARWWIILAIGLGAGVINWFLHRWYDPLSG